MNTIVQASPMTLGAVASLNDVSVSTSSLYDVVAIVDTPRLHILKTISINGHSIKSINPDFAKVGEETTLIAA